MKLFKYLVFSLLVSVAPYATAIAQESHTEVSTSFLHTIEKGQSLYSIASMYNVSSKEIITLNPSCEEKIYSGQTLRIPQSKEKKKNQVFHTIQPQETLYRLTQKYQISAKLICEANPGLSAESFRIGQVIAIPNGEKAIEEKTSTTVPTTPDIQPAVKPKCKDMHKVSRKETIFSVSREYGLTENELIAANPELRDGMKKGSFLCIPYPNIAPKKEEVAMTNPNAPSNNELFATRKTKDKSISPIKAAVILPFMVDGTSRGEGSRMIEYYEGFLMAVDSLKRTGISIDLYTYDSESESSSIKAILDKSEMKKMDIIFGPLHQDHIKPLSDFAKKHNIRLVIPFTSKDKEVFNNPYIFQVNTPQSYLYSEVYEHFLRKFTNANVIILETGSTDKEKVEFINDLKRELKANHITYKTTKVDVSSATLATMLDATKENFFVPTSGSDMTLIKIFPLLQSLVRENPTQNIHLFGYPEWQTYTKDHLSAFFELDTYFYSSFYTNNLLPQAIQFTSNYRKWYSKDMANTYPKYGMLGFDTAYFFLKGLSEHGSSFEENVSEMSLTPIQTGFKFERVNNWGGFINKKVFFVHFTKKHELIKLDFE